ncbi:MAG TPA: SUF system Fe-S cluster assembly regulator [Woeseiaceae bacterium]|nr:SUF system Fe-S cluster assembly regulator [Woeseiaceae bacterium]
MLRISKLTDYGTVVLAELARGEQVFVSAADIAGTTGLGVPTVSKLLKMLARAGLVTSSRGPRGGYRLARPATEISAADVIDALEGPVSITECSAHDSQCDIESLCRVGSTWQRINVGIRRALDEISLSDLLRTNSPLPPFRFANTRITVERKR